MSPEGAADFLRDYKNLVGNEPEQVSNKTDIELGKVKTPESSKIADAVKDADSAVGSESKKFAEVVRRMRRLQELSQEELAERAGLHRNFVGAVERGEMSVSLENAERLARALGVRLKDLL